MSARSQRSAASLERTPPFVCLCSWRSVDVLSQPITEEEDEREVSANADTWWLNAVPTCCQISLSQRNCSSFFSLFVWNIHTSESCIRGSFNGQCVCVCPQVEDLTDAAFTLHHQPYEDQERSRWTWMALAPAKRRGSRSLPTHTHTHTSEMVATVEVDGQFLNYSEQLSAVCHQLLKSTSSLC